MDQCPCGLEADFSFCCGPLISGEKKADTPEELMRSRYSAYVKLEMDYLLSTTHPSQRSSHDPKATRDWAESSEWNGLDIVSTHKGGPVDIEGTVEFIAKYRQKGERREHHELAVFKKVDDTWYFEDGHPVTPKQIVRETPKVGRNEPCPCGSGKKYKKCCAN